MRGFLGLSVSDEQRNRLLAAALMLCVFTAGIFFGLSFSPRAREATVQAGNAIVESVFSPGSESRLVAFVDSAQQSIDVELYQFSNSALKAALVRASQRGVRVRLILEPKVDTNLETAEFLGARGVSVKWASQKYANTHAKSAVVDSECVLVGSINWSQRAVDSNREAALIACAPVIAQQFERVFETDWSEATPIAA
ncbi:MAG: phospholipase D-like domain-containing protein [Candidatus Micrarchaeota archaeon]